MDLNFWKFQIFQWLFGFPFPVKKIHVSSTNHIWISKFPPSFWASNIKESLDEPT